MKKAFTLAEILIVLTVIGILTAILLPTAFHATPDKNVMKFKKSYSTLGSVIRELVNSDRYYFGGDLGQAPTSNPDVGQLVTDQSYFCNSFADIVSVKVNNCGSTANNQSTDYVNLKSTAMATAQNNLDSACNFAPTRYITTADDVVWYESKNATTFGSKTGANRIFANPEEVPATATNLNGFDAAYKVICFDVDGINNGEAPFGFGIRADGKILQGTRAQQWNDKSIQQDN